MWNDNRGAALAMVLLVLAVGMVIGGVILFLGTHETKMTNATESLTRAYYVARSGADAMGEYLINNPDKTSTVLNHGSAPVSIGGGESTITHITPVTEGSVQTVHIVAEGVVPGGYSRTATLVLEHFSKDSIFQYGLFSEENLQGEKIGTVDTTDSSDFPMGSNGTISSNANYPEGDYVKMEYQNKDYVEPTFPGEEDPITHAVEVPLPGTQPNIGGNGDDIINQNAVYNKIDKNGGSLTFDVSGGDLHVVVSSLSLKCPVAIIGAETVYLYIKNGSGSPDANFQTPINVGGNAEQFMVLLEEDSTMYLKANLMSYFYVYGPHASVELGSSDSTVTGSIIAGTFLANGKPDIIYKPLTGTGNVPGVNGYLRARWED